MKKFQRIIPIILSLLCVGCLVTAVWLYKLDHPGPNSDIISVTHTDIQEGTADSSNGDTENSIFEEIPKEELEEKSLASESESVSPGDEIIEEESEPVAEEPVIVPVENPYKDWFLQNDDMIAWIKIPDTVVDYPVMWTPRDENYYLYKDFNGNKDIKGCLLLDTDSSMDPLSTNLIIHGHNFSGIMFGDLHLYYSTNENREKYPYIYLYGKDYEHVYEVITAFKSKVYYTTDTCFKYYKFFNAETQEEFDDFYNNVLDLALYDSGVAAEFGDKFLTLSTCSEHVENGRFVVVAKEIEPGDTFLPVTSEN